MSTKLSLFVVSIVLLFSTTTCAQLDTTFEKNLKHLIERYRNNGYDLKNQGKRYIDFGENLAYEVIFYKQVGKFDPRHGGMVTIKEVSLIIDDRAKILKKKTRRYKLGNIYG